MEFKKLSDIKGERVFEVMPEVLDIAMKIAIDPDVQKALGKAKKPKGMTDLEYGAKRLESISDKVLNKHKDECIKLFSIIYDETPEEYLENLDFGQLIIDINNLMRDPTFSALFFSQGQGTNASSGSATENTEAPET